MTIRYGALLALPLAAALAIPAAWAQFGNVLQGSGALGSSGLGGLGGGLPGGSLGAGSMGNAAGVLTFCIKNNYLGGGGASGVRDALMNRLGGHAASSDPGYLDGASGILHGANVGQIALGGANAGDLKAEITRKVCDQILNQAKSML